MHDRYSSRMEQLMVSGRVDHSDGEEDDRDEHSVGGARRSGSSSEDDACSPSAIPYAQRMWEWCPNWKKLLWMRRPAAALWWINVVVFLGVFISEILVYESSPPSVRSRHHSTAIFPILVPAATAFAFGCKWQGSAALPNFVGFFVGQMYITARNNDKIVDVRVLYLLILSFVQTLEAQVGSDFLRRKLCRNGRKAVPTIDTVHDCLLYLVVVFGVSLCFETLAAVLQCTMGLVRWSAFARFWSTRWLGVLAALLTISPALIHLFAYGPPYSHILRKTKMLECMVLLIFSIGVMGLVIFSLPFTTVIRPLPYLLYPLIIFSVFRFNRLGWALLVAAIAFFGSWGSLHYESSALYYTSGSSARSSPKLLLQIALFMGVLGVVAISLAGAVREKKQLTKDLHHLNHRLEEAVNKRTQELVRANTDLQVSQAHAEKANLAKSDFLANMSHEIRTPIHGILGLTALLLQSELSGDQLENLLSVKDCADLLLHIINSILDLAKIEAGRLEVETVPFSIRKVVSGTLRMLQVRAKERGLQLLWKVDLDVPTLIAGDPGKLQQCLLNLVGNALKFTHNGSVWVHISLHPGFESSFSHVLSVRKEPMSTPPAKAPSLPARLRSWASWPSSEVRAEVDEDNVTSSLMKLFDTQFNESYLSSKQSQNRADSISRAEIREVGKSEYVLVEIRDTGIGMSEENVREMFNPFTQADASTSRLYGGTGLGLSIVQRFVELLGGKIWVESEVGKGSVFSFVVPFQRVDSRETIIGLPQSSVPVFQPLLDPSDKLRRVLRKTSLSKGRRAHSLNTLMKNLKFSAPQFSDAEPLLHLTSLDSSDGSALRKPLSKASAKVDTRDGSERSEDQGVCEKPGPSHASGKFSSDLPGLTNVEKEFTTTSREQDLTQGQLQSDVNVDTVGLGETDTMQRSNAHDKRVAGNSVAKRVVRSVPDIEAKASARDYYRDLELGIINGSGNHESIGHTIGASNSRKSDGALSSAVSQSARPKPEEISNVINKIPADGEQLQRPLPRKENFHVLLAEDNMINQKVATRQLQKHGHTVTVVGDGLQAVNAVRLHHDTFDLVLMDIQMPMMDGLEATEKIRAEECERGWQRIPILGLTAHAISGYQDTCLSHGMDAYLGKPFEISELLSIIKKFI